jgi:hypothetical protein
LPSIIPAKCQSPGHFRIFIDLAWPKPSSIIPAKTAVYHSAPVGQKLTPVPRQDSWRSVGHFHRPSFRPMPSIVPPLAKIAVDHSGDGWPIILACSVYPSPSAVYCSGKPSIIPALPSIVPARAVYHSRKRGLSAFRIEGFST